MSATTGVVVLRAVRERHGPQQLHLAHLPSGTVEPEGWTEDPFGPVRAVCGAELPDAVVVRRRARYLCSRCRRESWATLGHITSGALRG